MRNVKSRLTPLAKTLRKAGNSVARFPSGHMLSQPDNVLETIAAICEGRITSHIIDHDFQFYPAKPVILSNKGAPHPNPLPVNGERGMKADGND